MGRHAPSTRTRLWTVAWLLIFLHFFVQALETGTGTLERNIEAVDLAALELSGVVFCVSLGQNTEQKIRRWMALLSLGGSAVFHAWGASVDWRHPHVLALSLAAFFSTSLIYVLAARLDVLFKAALGSAFLAMGAWVSSAQWAGDADPGVTAILATSFAIPGLLFWRRYGRLSPGVLSVVGGFVAWGAVFPVGALTDLLLPQLKLNPEIWNVPKFIVAFGMILALLEDKTRQIEESNVRERNDNTLLERFSRLTSQLLAEKEPLALSARIAQAIHDAASFRRVAILIARENGSVFVAGAHGYSLEEEGQLRERVSHATLAGLQEMRRTAAAVGGKTFRGNITTIAAEQNGGEVPTAGPRQAEEGDLITPLLSLQGQELGWILLSGQGCAPDALLQQIFRIELFAADFSAQIENTRLQRQLVRAEKLAGIGQLVAGVAHELNNPLTGIIGYADIVAEEVKQGSVHSRVVKLGGEARRMKRIIDSLLRFSRMDNSQQQSCDLGPALQDALQLREYFVRSRGIEVSVNVAPDLPQLAISCDELKQVLLNLLGNALDAVENADERRIEISASLKEDQVLLSFEDSGAGFADPQRALDPFYTTKPVGRGTGLGLSICYGLVKNCGGEIHIGNREPHGASVTLMLPPAVLPCAQVQSASAR